MRYRRPCRNRPITAKVRKLNVCTYRGTGCAGLLANNPEAAPNCSAILIRASQSTTMPSNWSHVMPLSHENNKLNSTRNRYFVMNLSVRISNRGLCRLLPGLLRTRRNLRTGVIIVRKESLIFPTQKYNFETTEPPPPSFSLATAIFFVAVKAEI